MGLTLKGGGDPVDMGLEVLDQRSEVEVPDLDRTRLAGGDEVAALHLHDTDPPRVPLGGSVG